MLPIRLQQSISGRQFLGQGCHWTEFSTQVCDIQGPKIGLQGWIQRNVGDLFDIKDKSDSKGDEEKFVKKMMSCWRKEVILKLQRKL